MRIMIEIDLKDENLEEITPQDLIGLCENNGFLRRAEAEKFYVYQGGKNFEMIVVPKDKTFSGYECAAVDAVKAIQGSTGKGFLGLWMELAVLVGQRQTVEG